MLARLRQDDQSRGVGDALLDQRNLAGIGTFYRAEVCFLQGVHPRTPVAEVKDLPRLVQRAQQVADDMLALYREVLAGG